MASKYRFIGKVTPRKDAVDILTGRAKFLNDIKFPDMLYGKVLRSPHAHALIKKVDKSKAQKLEGVRAVLTWEDVPDWKGGTPRRTPVLGRKVRFVGDAVALVILDLHLPHVSGVDILHQIRQDTTLAQVHVIVTTADSALSRKQLKYGA